MSMRDEISVTLGELHLGPVHSGASELALLYARQLDTAAAVRAQADRALAKAYESGDPDLIEEMVSLRAKLSERDCVNQIGRGLMLLLDRLNATPKAMAELDKMKGHGGRQTPPSSGALARLRAVN